MMLLARAITQKFFTPTNNRLRASSNTRNQAVIHDGRVDIQTKNVGYGGNGNRNAERQNRNQVANARNVQVQQIDESHYARNCLKPKVYGAKYFREHMLLAMKDETGGTLNDEENDFMLDNAYGDETLEELTAVVIMMARIQLADDNAETDPKYDAKAVSEVNASHMDLISGMLSKGGHEHTKHEKLKTIINTSDDDKIDSNIIFDDPYMENNGRIVKHASNAHDLSFDIEYLVYNVQREDENQQRINIEITKQKELLIKELETSKERVKTLEFKSAQCSKYKETCDELELKIQDDKDTIERILKEKDKTERDYFKSENEKVIIQHETQLAKKAFKTRENSYLEDIVDLNDKLSSHDRIVYKMGRSIQTIHMLGKRPNKVYDPFLKAGLGYQNFERLKKAIAAQPKMYDGERLHNTKLIIESPDYEEIFEDAEESRLKMKNMI
ncbi:hypothetical protein Tco_0784516 [Tanacetum coccineum]